MGSGLVELKTQLTVKIGRLVFLPGCMPTANSPNHCEFHYKTFPLEAGGIIRNGAVGGVK